MFLSLDYMNFFRSPTLSPGLPLYAETVTIYMANVVESSYDFGHDSNISYNMIIFKYLDIEAIESDTSISYDEL